MANFPTHISVGTVVSGVLATATLAADAVTQENLLAVTMAGVIGSVLPDMDLKESRPSRAMFSGLAVFFSFVALFLTVGKLSIVEMLVLWLGTLVFVRYGAHWIFHRMSYHRGIWHSWLAAVLCALATAVIYYHLLGRNSGVSWLAAAFMFIGYLTHLTLDEIYSVDVMDTRIKASFGTALKLADFKHWGHTASMAATVALVYLATPPTKMFTDVVASRSLWTGLQGKLLPAQRDHWFGIDWSGLAQQRPNWLGTPRRAGTDTPPTGPEAPPATGLAPEQGNPITTGSIKAPAVPVASPQGATLVDPNVVLKP